jgi:Fe-S cluster assembly protein SufD
MRPGVANQRAGRLKKGRRDMTSVLLEHATGERAGAVAGPRALLHAGPMASEPGAWLNSRRREAWEEFVQLPVPVRTNEAWRFTNLKHLDLGRFIVAPPLDAMTQRELPARSIGFQNTAGRMVFGNDGLVAYCEVSEALRKQGVLWLPLAQAIAEHPELVEKYFMREEATLGGRKYAALHLSQVRAGTFLHVPRGVRIELPFETWHWLGGNGASCFPHTLIAAEPMSCVTMIDWFQSTSNDADGLACGVNDLHLGDGAAVTYLCAQRWSARTVAMQINSTVVGRDAKATALNMNLGALYARSENVSHLRGPGGRSDMLALSVAEATQEIDQRTLQIHEVPHTASDLLYKNALDDQARTIFAGLIRVEPGAHQTDAYQKVRNLLLSDDAEANSAPGLEIEADDVRCTHGATTGQIEEEELFYLSSRGIPKAQAQRLIVHGFLKEVVDRVGDPAIADRFDVLIQEKLERRSR